MTRTSEIAFILVISISIIVVIFIAHSIDNRRISNKEIEEIEVETWLETTISADIYSPISAQYKSTPLRDVLDSMCVIWDCEWKIDGSRIVIETKAR